MAVVPLPSVYVVANFKETQIEGMVPGQHADVAVDALSGKVFKGEIESFAPASGALFSLLPPENATGNFTKIVQRIPVRFKLAGTADELALLRAGMSVNVTVDLRDKPAAKKP
jgi:membrane fusion protein (multidrug efflux system)